MSAFTPAHSRRLDLALALLRSAVGAVFVAHGAQKLFTFGLAGVAGAFGQMGIPFAGVVGPAVAFLEFFGGIALIAGAGTRVAGLGLALNMLGALTMVHLPGGFFLPSGIEFVLTLAAATAALTLTGAGAYSVDARIAGRRKPDAAPAALVTPVATRRAA